jgi:ABC-2 type transport system ATP-binding protein
MEKTIEVINLKKYYGKARGVEDVSFSLDKGEVFGFIGPNGAGKSTTIRSMLNLINKTDGEVLIKGKAYQTNDVEMKKTIGYLPSEVCLYDDLTVKAMLDYHERFHGAGTHEKRKRLVELLELDESKKMEDLSLGNKKKVGIVLALAHDPEIIILDEPTSGLDPIMQQTFYRIIQEEKEQGKTIIYSTHILEEVSKICDMVGIIKDGVMVKTDSVENLTKNSFLMVTITSTEKDEMMQELSAEIISSDENTIKFKTKTPAGDLIKSLAKYSIDKILIEEPTIEELFMHYYE